MPVLSLSRCLTWGKELYLSTSVSPPECDDQTRFCEGKPPFIQNPLGMVVVLTEVYKQATDKLPFGDSHHEFGMEQGMLHREGMAAAVHLAKTLRPVVLVGMPAIDEF